MTWWQWLLVWIAVSFPVAIFIGNLIRAGRGNCVEDRYWEMEWEPENITEICDRLRIPPPSKL